MRKIVIGTRGSKLALTQSEVVKAALQVHYANVEIELKVIKTTGDMVQDRSLALIGGKGLFTKEIEQELLAGTVDIAVHSLKDMPSVMPDGLVADCFLKREDPRDALLVASGRSSIKELPLGAVFGTSSTRRTAQMLHLRPDLQIVPFRGNVQTRMEKLQAGIAEATILAAAGLKRLQIDPGAYSIIDVADSLPAVGQGVIVVQAREDDSELHELLAKINDQSTEICVQAERGFLSGLGASCVTPIAAYAELIGDEVYLRSLIASIDGKVIHRKEGRAGFAGAGALGRRLSAEFLDEFPGFLG